MKAQALVCSKSQEFQLADVTLAEPGESDLVVRALYSGVSIGTEFALIRNKISWGPFPICTGYQAVGVVERVGAKVEDFRVGQKIYYRNQPKFTLPDGTAVSPTSGMHCSMAVVPPNETHGPAPLPEGVDDAAASLFVMPAVGLFGTDMAGPKLGQTVVVYGVGLIGLGVVAACSHRGCVVVAVDLNDTRLKAAKLFGADFTLHGDATDLPDQVRRIAPEGTDVVFECTGIPKCIQPATQLARPFGKFVYQGNYGNEPFPWHFMSKHVLRLTEYFPCDDGYGPCRRAVLKNMASGALPWDKIMTHRVPAKDAPAFYERINRGDDKDILGAAIQWS